MRVAGRVALPKKLVNVDPVYPTEARAGRIEGVVVLQGIIGTDGDLGSLTVLRSVPELDEAALAATRLWVYRPVMLEEKPIRLRFVFTVSFTLDQGASNSDRDP